MASNEITCPSCGHNIPIDQVLVQRLNEQVNEKVTIKLAQEKAQLEEELKKKYSESQNSALKEIEQKLVIETQKRQQSEQKELKFLKEKSEMEDKIRNQELEVARRMQEEKKLIEEKVQKEKDTEYQLKLLERDKQLEDQKKLIAEMQRKAHQGSMQTQGEVLELSLEELLRQTFPLDKIEPVPKGISGADIIQTVYSTSGQPSGIIAWESKRTKNWTEEWVQKLKDDSRNIKANLSVLVSEILPKDINHFGHYNGIWVCDFPSTCGLAMALRSQLMAVSSAIVANTGKDQKMESLYSYLCSDTFAQRVQALVETFMNMKTSLDKEKIAMTKIWASREGHLLRLTENTAKMYGEIQSIAGAALPTIDLLEFEEVGDSAEEKPAKKSQSLPEPDPTTPQANLF